MFFKDFPLVAKVFFSQFFFRMSRRPISFLGFFLLNRRRKSFLGSGKEELTGGQVGVVAGGEAAVADVAVGAEGDDQVRSGRQERLRNVGAAPRQRTRQRLALRQLRPVDHLHNTHPPITRSG